MNQFSPTDEQIAQFNHDGFIMVENLIDNDTVERLRDAFNKLFDGEFETGVQPDEVNWQSQDGDPTLTRQICNGWRANKTVAEVVLREDLGKAIAQFGNWPGSRIMIDNVLWKPPATRELGYHQDNAYLRWFHPGELLSCWIALDDTTAEGGTVEFVVGSHKWTTGKPEGEFHGPEDYRKYMRLAAQREGIEPEIVYVEVPKGGGSFHHGWTWHGSGFNSAKLPRRALVLHAMRSDVQYVPEQLGQGTGPIYSRYKRLGDASMDENYFPILWRNDGYRTKAIELYLSQ